MKHIGWWLALLFQTAAALLLISADYLLGNWMILSGLTAGVFGFGAQIFTIAIVWTEIKQW